MIEVEIKTEFIKLDQFLKWAGIVGTGADAKAMINEGSINVNGETVFQRGKKLYKGDRIIVNGGDEFIIVQ